MGHFPGKIYFSELYFFKKFLLPLPGGGGGGDCLSRPLDKGGGGAGLPPKFFRPFGPHFGPKIRGNLASRAAPLDPALFALKLELFCSKLSSCSVFFDFELIINIYVIKENSLSLLRIRLFQSICSQTEAGQPAHSNFFSLIVIG